MATDNKKNPEEIIEELKKAGVEVPENVLDAIRSGEAGVLDLQMDKVSLDPIIDAARAVAESVGVNGNALAKGATIEILLAAAAQLYGYRNAPTVKAHAAAFTVGAALAEATLQMNHEAPYGGVQQPTWQQPTSTVLN